MVNLRNVSYSLCQIMHYRYLLKLDVECAGLSINLSLSSTLAWIIAI